MAYRPDHFGENIFIVLAEPELCGLAGLGLTVHGAWLV